MFTRFSDHGPARISAPPLSSLLGDRRLRPQRRVETWHVNALRQGLGGAPARRRVQRIRGLCATVAARAERPRYSRRLVRHGIGSQAVREQPLAGHLGGAFIPRWQPLLPPTLWWSGAGLPALNACRRTGR